jgi:mannonate dehydratase
MTAPTLRVAAGQIRDLTDEKLRFAVQLGVSGVQINTPLLPGDSYWEEDVLRAQVLKCQEYGLTLESLENVPAHFYSKAMLGLPGRDEQIENYQRTIRNVGKAGIPILGFHFMPNFVWRTEWLAPGRGGAGCTKFDLAAVEQAEGASGLRQFVAIAEERKDEIPLFTNEDEIVTHEQMWANYVYFMNAVLPVAEEAGVKLALHPDDPPVPMLGGVARLFHEPAGFKRAYELNPDSPSWGLNLCLGCCSEMTGGKANVVEMIEYFGPKGKILYSHFRDVQGEVPNFQECFIGEGNYDPAEIILLLKKNGFTGFLLDDHVPHMDDDTEYGHRGRAHAIGYIQGLIRMMNYLQ